MKFFSFLMIWMVAFKISPSEAVTFVHSNDVLGDIEPCGCRTNPQGGMARKANLLNTIKDSFVLQLDGGDLLFSSERLPGILKKQSELQAEYLLKAMDRVHHDAAVPGEKDFALGLSTFEKLRKKTKVQFLAANLILKKTGKRLLAPSALFTGMSSDGTPPRKIRVGVIGWVGAALKWPKELKVLPALELVKSEVQKLIKKVDFIVLLTHQGLEEDLKLAKSLKGIDLIIGGHSQSFLQTPIQVGSTLIIQSSFKNQYVGVLPFSRPLEPGRYRLVGLDAGYDSPPELPSEMDLLVKNFKTAVAELNSQQESELEKVTPDEGLVSPFQTFPRCAECHLKQFQFWRKTDHFMAFETLFQKQQSKNKECLSCHTVGFGNPHGFEGVNGLAEFRTEQGKPQGFSHEELAFFLKEVHEATSLENSIKLRQGETQSYPVSEALHRLEKSWTPVQCENCHQPGGNHPFSGQYSKKVEKTLCLNCHTAERAPSWYTSAGQPNLELIEAKKKGIACPAGDLE